MATPSIKISNLDFNEVKQNLKDFLRQKPELQDYDFEGSGWSYLIDLLSYYHVYSSFYVNMVGNEMFLDSAQLKESVNSKAKLLGYLPKSRRSSHMDLRVRMGPKAGSTVPPVVYIPAGTPFIGNNTYNKKFEFVVTEPKTLFLSNPSGLPSDFYPANPSLPNFPEGYFEATLVVHEGALLTHRYIVTSDYKEQRFQIPNPNIDTNSMRVVVQESETNLIQDVYDRVTDITDVTSTSKIYYIQRTGNANLYEIYFGDGVLSAGISPGNIVIITYMVCAGEEANGVKLVVPSQYFYMIPPDFIPKSYSNFTNTVDVISQSSGGEADESIRSIKNAAPINFEMQNRAVTKLDFEQIIQRDYPRIDSITVWGGEDHDPPEYGRVFICIKPSAGYLLDNGDKLTIINQIVKPRCTLTQEPVIVDPDYVNIVITSEVKFNFRLTTKTKQEIQFLVYNSILSFNETNLEKFERGFVYSDFVTMIDELDSSIYSNLTSIRLKKTISPVIGQKETYVLNMLNALDVYDNKGTYGKSIYSSFFYYVDTISKCFFAEDDFKSDVLSLFRIDPYTNIPVRIAKMGTISHETGKIEITEPFTPLGWIDRNSKIDFFAKPVINDIYSARNSILVIDPVDVFVSAKEIS